MTNIPQMRVGDSILIGPWVIKRISRKDFRLGEFSGAWVMSGPRDAVIERMNSKVQ